MEITNQSGQHLSYAEGKVNRAIELLKSIRSAEDTHKKVPEILKLCMEAAKADPLLIKPYMILADISMQLGNFEDSAALLKKALEIEPTNLFIAGKHAMLKKQLAGEPEKVTTKSKTGSLNKNFSFEI